MGKKKKKTKHLNKSLEKKTTLVNLLNLTKQQYTVLWIIAGIFIIRLIYFFELSKNDPLFYQPLPGTDQHMYWQAAYQIINGEFPMTPFGYNPLYYYFLALALKISDCSLFGVRVIQALLGVGICILVYLMGKRLFNYHVGLMGLILSGICGTLIFHEGILLSTTLTTFLSTACLFFLLRLKEKFNKRDLIISGISLGLATLSQPNVILFLPFAILWLFFSLPFAKKKAIIICSIFSLTFFLSISPVTIRNYFASGKLILLTSAGSFQFWLGNNEHAPGWYDLCEPYLSSLEKRMQEERKDLFVEDVVRFIKEKPAEYVNLLFKKILLFWGNWDIPHQVGYDDTKKYSFILRLPILPDFGLITILGLTGMILSIRNYRKFLLLYLFIITYSFSVILFLVVGRYRPPVLPLLIIFSAFSLWWIYNKVKVKQFQLLSLCLIPIGCFSILVYNQTIIDQIHMVKYPNGVMERCEDGFILTDSSNRNNRGFAIDSDKKMIKKEVILGIEPSKIKEVYLNLTYNCGQEGRLNMKLNGKELPVLNFKDLYDAVRGIVGQVSLGPINSATLKKGVNVITLQVEEKGYINIPIDACYNYGRSLFSLDNGNTWKKEKGEYKIELKLISKSL